MDINADTSATLPSSDTVGLTYFVGSTNATGASPTATTKFFLANPGTFAVAGTVFAAAQGLFTDTPPQLVFASDRASELYFSYNEINSAQPALVPGTTFTCTIYDGQTLLGSASTVVGGSTSGGVTNAFAQCTGVYPSNAEGPSANGHAFVTIPSTYNTSDVYTYLISR